MCYKVGILTYILESEYSNATFPQLGVLIKDALNDKYSKHGRQQENEKEETHIKRNYHDEAAKKKVTANYAAKDIGVKTQ